VFNSAMRGDHRSDRVNASSTYCACAGFGGHVLGGSSAGFDGILDGFARHTVAEADVHDQAPAISIERTRRPTNGGG
jgi:hypothetical protein